MNSAQQIIEQLVCVLVSSQKKYTTEEDIVKAVEKARGIQQISDEEADEVVKDLESKLFVKIDRGSFLKDKNHKPWYLAAKKDITPKYWDRYRKYLQIYNGFAVNVVDELEKTTEDIMDLLGNPNSETGFVRRGLVIGDVQSGKTSTYTGLINKAADSGYKIIILLTGTIEKLRKQTQSRLDAGFTGIDSTAFINNKENNVGVGKIDRSVSGWSLTSTTSDFNTITATQFNGKLVDIKSPVLFVLKKNKSVLENLESWLRLRNSIDGKIASPMLMIDDEADNASINTKKDEDSPTAINGAIRKLLKLFTRANYVAFTATPYANIFINPNSESEMYDNDLFPGDFIYALTAPSNYIGANAIFSEGGKFSYLLKNNDDCGNYLPMGHKKDYDFIELPQSLKEAIASFYIVNTIRDLRGDTTVHRTMLVNISRFIAVQNQIAQVINGYCLNLTRQLQNYSQLGDEALRHEGIAFIKLVYDKHYSNLPNISNMNEKYFTWDNILKHMAKSVLPIVVRSVNGGNASKNLNYDECEEDGLRLIAVGGYSLSRGLTLEGLCISYFYRNSKMYDTLMQMGRWFGYRLHYADLCQIWMSDDSIEWYRYISDATEDLKIEVKKMQNAGRTPRDFGLGVRSDIHALYVTALNKMRSSEEVELTVSLSGRMIETPYISYDVVGNELNKVIVSKWLNKLNENGFDKATEKNGEKLATSSGIQILNVDSNYIVELIREVAISPFNLEFSVDSMTNAITENNSLEKWDVAIATGKKTDNNPSCLLGKYEIIPVSRKFGIREHHNKVEIQMSGSKSRLGSTNYAYIGLTKNEKEDIENSVKNRRSQEETDPNRINRAFSENDYFSNSGVKRNPILVIYPVALKCEDEKDSNELSLRKEEIAKNMNNVCIGFAVGIPSNGGKSISTKYRVNTIKYQELLGIDKDDYDEEIEENYD